MIFGVLNPEKIWHEILQIVGTSDRSGGQSVRFSVNFFQDLTRRNRLIFNRVIQKIEKMDVFWDTGYLHTYM